MTKELKSQTTKALFWSAFERFGQQAIQLVISIILARKLYPEQFGLIAMLAVFVAIAQSFVDCGFGQALIQNQKARHIDESSMFYFNVFIGFVSAFLLCLCAPWIAAFYGRNELVPLTRVLSLNLVINGFGLVHGTLLSKQLDFKTQFKASLIATLISGLISVFTAYRGFGVWALVSQSVSMNLIRTILLWAYSSWRPRLEFSFSSLRSMFAFGSRLAIAGLLNTFFENVYNVVIGKLYASKALGFYSRGRQAQQFTTSSLTGIASRVAFPMFSRVQGDKEHLKRGMRKALTMLIMVSFPLTVGLAVTARPLVLLLLGEKWEPCVPYIQLICLAELAFPLHVINLNALTSQGHSGLFLRIEIIKKILVVLNIAITCYWGITAMICGQIVVSYLSFYINSYYTGKLLDYSFREQLVDIRPYLLAAIVMAGAAYAVHWIVFPEGIWSLACPVIVAASVYCLICYSFRLSAFFEIRSILPTGRLS